MEKVGLNPVLPPLQSASATRTARAAQLSASASSMPARRVTPAPQSAGRPFMDVAAPQALSDLLSLDDMSGIASSGLGVGTVTATDGAEDGGSDAASSLDDYEAMLEGSRHDKSSGPFNGVPLFGLSQNARQTVQGASQGRGDSRLTTFEAEEASTEEFSIAHPQWGKLDVKSSRTSTFWYVHVRCDDPNTGRLLESRKDEFRDMLNRTYGVSLELDVQPGATS